MKLLKIKSFNFLEFLWPPVHETSQKSGDSIFLNFHDPQYMKLQNLQFYRIFMTLYMKLHKNQKLPFSWIFMTPGTWNFTKIKSFNFLEFLWPPVHVSWNSLGKQKKTLVTLLVYFWRLINGFEVLKIPAPFSLTETGPPCQNLSWTQHAMIRTRNWASLPKLLRSFWLTLSCFPPYVVGTAETLASFVK